MSNERTKTAEQTCLKRNRLLAALTPEWKTTLQLARESGYSRGGVLRLLAVLLREKHVKRKIGMVTIDNFLAGSRLVKTRLWSSAYSTPVEDYVAVFDAPKSEIRERCLQALRESPEWAPTTKIASAAKLTNEQAHRLLTSLENAGIAHSKKVLLNITDTSKKGKEYVQSRVCRVWRLNDGQGDNDE